MANWDNVTSTGQVDDRRGRGSMLALGGGGLGLTGLIIYLAINLLAGNGSGGSIDLPNVQMVPSTQVNSKDFEGVDNYELFTSKVLGSANDMWQKAFEASGKSYTPPQLVLFRGATQSGCGVASSESGPHYCPIDKTIYLDETFFQELQARFKAKGGDVAEAYVIAHEAGHHAQNLLGVLDDVHSHESQDLDIKAELQADCFAGLWAYSLKDKSVFESGEFSEALDAAAAVGDDRIQKQVEGSVHPETWTHGSSEQRVQWFTKGYESGSVSACNTF